MIGERLLIALFLLTAGVVLYCWYRQCQIRRAAANPRDPLLTALTPGIPAIIYFTTPTCAPCRLQQRPAIEQVRGRLGDAIQVMEIDASVDAHHAERWGVFTAPTTFILDRSLTPRAVNHGVADVSKLLQQIHAVSQVDTRAQ
ncbi:MAG: thioredoxin family protein [Candidatus Flexifilum sp.]|jgi:thiol-disulfide isomerase/thioredoxin